MLKNAFVKICALYLLCLSQVRALLPEPNVVKTMVEYPPNTLDTFQGSSSSCGGKLVSSSGTISYKNFQAYSPNERCVWTIRAPNATSYGVQLESLGNPGTLVITGFGIGDAVKHSIPNAVSNISMTTSNMLVVVFYTPSTNNTSGYRGFSLQYTASISETNPKASITSEDIINFANRGHIKYPSNASVYGNFDLSTIILVPLLGIQNPEKRTELVYIRSELEGQSCQDRLSVYVLNTQTTNKWSKLGRMCGGVDSEFITSRDVIMLVFESDSSGVYSGFHLYSRYL